MIVDGAYLKVGAKTLEDKTKRELKYTDFAFKQIFEYIQTKARARIDKKVYISAVEMPANNAEGNIIRAQNDRQKKLLEDVGFEVDMRWFKPKNSYCKEATCLNCPHNRNTKDFKPIIVSFFSKPTID